MSKKEDERGAIFGCGKKRVLDATILLYSFFLSGLQTASLRLTVVINSIVTRLDLTGADWTILNPGWLDRSACFFSCKHCAMGHIVVP